MNEKEIDERFERDFTAAHVSLNTAVDEIRKTFLLTAQDVGMQAADKWAEYCTHATLSAVCGEMANKVGGMLDATYMMVREREANND